MMAFDSAHRSPHAEAVAKVFQNSPCAQKAFMILLILNKPTAR